jgi:hypothetical protein
MARRAGALQCLVIMHAGTARVPAASIVVEMACSRCRGVMTNCLRIEIDISIIRFLIYGNMRTKIILCINFNGGVYEKLGTEANVEFQDAAAKNQATHGSQVDGDVFFMKIKLK